KLCQHTVLPGLVMVFFRGGNGSKRTALTGRKVPDKKQLLRFAAARHKEGIETSILRKIVG
ncbi:MAG: hypothetical protein KAT81_06030, partial [Syntrophobacterales bacterium]|nr:hypothetical protein [Syntrophobacterales bacterium]